MANSRRYQIEDYAGDGKLEKLKEIFKRKYTQLEIDVALENAIAYSQLETADYLLSCGANFSNYDYQGVYYAVHNDELEGLKYSIAKGVDINVRNGMILNTSIMTAINTKSTEMIEWILENGADLSLITKESINLIESYASDKMKKIITNSTK